MTTEDPEFRPNFLGFLSYHDLDYEWRSLPRAFVSIRKAVGQDKIVFASWKIGVRSWRCGARKGWLAYNAHPEKFELAVEAQSTAPPPHSPKLNVLPSSNEIR
jgi:hypothetical protein